MAKKKTAQTVRGNTHADCHEAWLLYDLARTILCKKQEAYKEAWVAFDKAHKNYIKVREYREKSVV